MTSKVKLASCVTQLEAKMIIGAAGETEKIFYIMRTSCSSA